MFILKIEHWTWNNIVTEKKAPKVHMVLHTTRCLHKECFYAFSNFKREIFSFFAFPHSLPFSTYLLQWTLNIVAVAFLYDFSLTNGIHFLFLTESYFFVLVNMVQCIVYTVLFKTIVWNIFQRRPTTKKK